MIKNLILDMGNVMLEFAPQRLVEALGIDDPSICGKLFREVFQSLEWVQMDWGVLDENAAAARILPRLPEELREYAEELIFRWNEKALPVSGMADLVGECKRAGLQVYLLSNASVRLPEYWPAVPGSSLFDGIVVSGMLGVVKPMPEIYRYVLKTYDLQAEACLFVDDMPMNVAGAIQVGMHGFVFRGDVSALRQEIRRLGGI